MKCQDMFVLAKLLFNDNILNKLHNAKQIFPKQDSYI